MILSMFDKFDEVVRTALLSPSDFNIEDVEIAKAFLKDEGVSDDDLEVFLNEQLVVIAREIML